MPEIFQGVMIESEVEKTHSDDYSTVVYWHTHACIDSPPYRKIVEWILQELRKRYRAELVAEPAECEGEDFIFHDLEVDGREMQIYWENSLGYISFISDNRDLIQELLSRYLSGRKPEFESV